MTHRGAETLTGRPSSAAGGALDAARLEAQPEQVVLWSASVGQVVNASVTAGCSGPVVWPPGKRSDKGVRSWASRACAVRIRCSMDAARGLRTT